MKILSRISNENEIIFYVLGKRKRKVLSSDDDVSKSNDEDDDVEYVPTLTKKVKRRKRIQPKYKVEKQIREDDNDDSNETIRIRKRIAPKVVKQEIINDDIDDIGDNTRRKTRAKMVVKEEVMNGEDDDEDFEEAPSSHSDSDWESDQSSENMKITKSSKKKKTTSSTSKKRQRVDYKSLHNTCPLCNYIFSKKSRLLRHLSKKESCQQDESTPINCHLCSSSGIVEILESRSAFVIHLKSQHNNDQRKNVDSSIKDKTCPVCSRLFKYAVNMKRHFEEQHEKNESYKCSRCLKEFNRKDRYTAHLQTHLDKHLQDKLLAGESVQICSKTLVEVEPGKKVDKDTEIVTLKLCKELNEKNRTCTACSKIFTSVTGTYRNQ
jgi:hypothetical protein